MKRWVWAALLAGTACCALSRSTRLPPHEPEGTRPARPHPKETRLGRAARRRVGLHLGKSGIHLLTDAQDSFAARVLLARQAERTLDLQYYIWHGDLTGTILLDEVLRAAERGVKVRLLLDDNGISGMDRILASMDRHPNIQVRIFNPFLPRFPKSLGFLLDFHRLNRRMHNKAFIADNAATIVGGRNVGDEYFGAGDGGLFADLDVLAIGPVVQDVTTSFEDYWHCRSAYPAARILGRGSARLLRRLHRRAARLERDPKAEDFMRSVAALPIITRFLSGDLPLSWAKVRMMADDPEKALGKASRNGLLAGRMFDAMGRPRHELGIVAGYFVPGRNGVAALARLARAGVSVSVLTNAYEATDTGIVHAGYAPSRLPLLRAGVRMFEMRGKTAAPSLQGSGPLRTPRGIGSRWRGSGQGSTARLRAHASTLHAKTFTVDRKRIFIGSFNFDPRSWELNTEMGFVIESAALAARVADAFEAGAPHNAYELRLRGRKIEWLKRDEGRLTRIRKEPGLGPMGRIALRAATAARIQWLL
ncbi:phospholipase D family protein [Falsirhodobacter halotolerans]|uniref:phospholipase D family protein n=1 Tax=Falsirhodobacter halotolerans TaxID=1146892 RepID=UPI001FD5C218|nr:phospholipase D family protein [Falsirhodobacter halotolerans]MCJ8141179.1 phospholipase D family protein [Falsirhodobacter halotolerans]